MQPPLPRRDNTMSTPELATFSRDYNQMLGEIERRVQWRYSITIAPGGSTVAPWEFTIVEGTTALTPAIGLRQGDTVRMVARAGTCVLTAASGSIRGAATLSVTQTPVELTWDGVQWW
jgi:hypothetical protein